MKPTWQQQEPKLWQKGAQGTQMEPKGSQKRAKREPKRAKETSKGPPAEKYRFLMRNSAHVFFYFPVLGQKSIKNALKNQCTNPCRKSVENVCQSGPKIKLKRIQNQ